MPLSEKLISQFVQATKPETKKKKETFVHGKIVESNGQYYVQIDGSSTLTPVSITTNINKEQPVTVMIKNHSATVIGNVAADVQADESGILNSTSTLSVSAISNDYIDSLWADYESETES